MGYNEYEAISNTAQSSEPQWEDKLKKAPKTIKGIVEVPCGGWSLTLDHYFPFPDNKSWSTVQKKTHQNQTKNQTPNPVVPISFLYGSTISSLRSKHKIVLKQVGKQRNYSYFIIQGFYQ